MNPKFDHSKYTELGIGDRVEAGHYKVAVTNVTTDRDGNHTFGYGVIPVANHEIGTIITEAETTTYLRSLTVERSQPRSLPADAAARKALPLCTGVLDYFPDALLAVAYCSKKGNDQHSPGQPLHWDRSKSQDEADALVRHLLSRGTRDTDGVRHSAKVAWRALALLQKEIETDAGHADHNTEASK